MYFLEGFVQLEVSADGLSGGVWPFLSVPHALLHPDAQTLTPESQGRGGTRQRQDGENQDPTCRGKSAPSWAAPTCNFARVKNSATQGVLENHQASKHSRMETEGE